jgi:aminopeptidase N
MEKASGLELKSFFTQWLYRSENMTVNGTWKYDNVKKQVMVTLSQSVANEFLFDVPIEFGLYKNGNLLPEIVKFRVNTKQNIFIIPAEVKPEKIIIDPRTVLLAVTEFSEEK